MIVLEVNDIVKKFGDYTAVGGVSFNVEKGRIMGVLGPNGAGKTTTIRMINNILIPDEGNISIFGEKVSYDLQNRIGYLPEERGLYKKVKVIDQLVYFAQLKGMSKSEAIEKGKLWLRRVDAADWETKKIQELSKGMQQKVQFISTILHDPELLILDEPFSGFDPLNVELLKRIILDLKDEGKTILLSTHVMEQAEQMCDDIVLISKGRHIRSGNLRDIKKSFGKDTIVMEFDGEDSFLNNFKGLKFVNKSKNRVEFRITNNEITLKEIVRSALDSVDLYKFELVEPSLREIFIDLVSDKEEVNNG
jgi:ABC-2 type transport system ATP-binding protein